MDRRGHTKIAGYYSLNPDQKDLLKKLYAWRFKQAKTENCAIFMFLPDEVLFDLVHNVENIKEILPAEKFKLYGLQLQQFITENRI
jgi:ribonuclease D